MGLLQVACADVALRDYTLATAALVSACLEDWHTSSLRTVASIFNVLAGHYQEDMRKSVRRHASPASQSDMASFRQLYCLPPPAMLRELSQGAWRSPTLCCNLIPQNDLTPIESAAHSCVSALFPGLSFAIVNASGEDELCSWNAVVLAIASTASSSLLDTLAAVLLAHSAHYSCSTC